MSDTSTHGHGHNHEHHQEHRDPDHDHRGPDHGLEDVRHVVDDFDARAPQYDDSQMHRELAAQVAAFAGLDGVHSVLDVATGTALVLRALPASPDRRLVGADISPGMLGVATRELPEAEFVLVDADPPLPFPDGSFDLITCVTGLHLMPDMLLALRDWRRLLAPHGRVVVGTFATDSENPGHGRHPHRLAQIGTPTVLAQLAADSGLELTRTTRWAYAEPHDVCMIAELAQVD